MPEPPAPSDGPDPIDSDDTTVLRAEILRLRDALLGERSRNAVLHDRVGELEDHVERLGADNEALHDELSRHPLTRALRTVARRLDRST